MGAVEASGGVDGGHGGVDVEDGDVDCLSHSVGDLFSWQWRESMRFIRAKMADNGGVRFRCEGIGFPNGVIWLDPWITTRYSVRY